MNVSLTKELEEFVNAKLKSGRYSSASEVVREGLRLLEHEDELRELQRVELRKAIAAGAEQAKSGKTIPGDQVFEDLRKRSQRRRRGQ